MTHKRTLLTELEVVVLLAVVLLAVVLLGIVAFPSAN